MSAESGVYSIFAALATVQIMQACDVHQDAAKQALEAVSKPYIGKEMSTDDLTEMLLQAIDRLGRNKGAAAKPTVSKLFGGGL